MDLRYLHPHYCSPPPLTEFTGPLNQFDLELMHSDVLAGDGEPDAKEEDLREIEDALRRAVRGKEIYWARDSRGLYFAVRVTAWETNKR